MLEENPHTEGATVVSILLASDKTLLTQFRNKSAYPVYVTIANIPKDIRKKPLSFAQILVGFLPAEKLDYIDTKSRRTLAMHDLLHGCFAKIFESLAEPGRDGVLWPSKDGKVYKCFPTLSGLVVDYPEQSLLTGAKSGRCHTCTVPKEALGQLPIPPFHFIDRSPQAAIDTWRILGRDPDWNVYRDACKEIGMRPLKRPFWVGLPYVNIFRCITPDILHQLPQGMFSRQITPSGTSVMAYLVSATFPGRGTAKSLRSCLASSTGFSQVLRC